MPDAKSDSGSTPSGSPASAATPSASPASAAISAARPAPAAVSTATSTATSTVSPSSGAMLTASPSSDAISTSSSNSTSVANSSPDASFNSSGTTSTAPTDILPPEDAITENGSAEDGSEEDDFSDDDFSDDGSFGTHISDPPPPPLGPPAIVEVWTHWLDDQDDPSLYLTSVVVYWQHVPHGLQYCYTTHGEPFSFLSPGSIQPHPPSKRLLLGVTRTDIDGFHERLNNDHSYFSSQFSGNDVNTAISIWITILLDVADVGDFDQASVLHLNEPPYSGPSSTLFEDATSVRHEYTLVKQSELDWEELVSLQPCAVVAFVDYRDADHDTLMGGLRKAAAHCNSSVAVRVPLLLVPHQPDHAVYALYEISTTPTLGYVAGTRFVSAGDCAVDADLESLASLFKDARIEIGKQNPHDSPARVIPFRPRAALDAPGTAILRGPLLDLEWRIIPFTAWFDWENEQRALAISVLSKETRIVARELYDKPVSALGPFMSMMHCEIVKAHDGWKWKEISILMRLLGRVATALVREQEEAHLSFIHTDGSLLATQSELRLSARDTLVACSHLMVTLLTEPRRAREGMKEHGSWQMMYIVLCLLSSKDEEGGDAHEAEKFMMLSIAAAFNYVRCATFPVENDGATQADSEADDTMTSDRLGLLSCGMTWANVLVTAIEHWQKRNKTPGGAGTALSYWNLDNLVYTFVRVIFFSSGHCPPMTGTTATSFCELLDEIQTNIESTPKPAAEGEHIYTAALMTRAYDRIAELRELVEYVCI